MGILSRPAGGEAVGFVTKDSTMEDNYGNLISSLAKENDKRIVLLVMDGVGEAAG